MLKFYLICIDMQKVDAYVRIVENGISTGKMINSVVVGAMKKIIKESC